MNRPATIVILGSILVVFAATFASVMWPMHTMRDRPSNLWRASKSIEARGREHYKANGCLYCHTQFIRPQDWGIGAERIAEAGDYYRQSPPLLGSERTGPDLSEEGGEHPNDWHLAHFINPRFTRPRSLMPRFAFIGSSDLNELTAYLQSLGGKRADDRVKVQDYWRPQMIAAYRRGPDANIQWLHSQVPSTWRPMPTESAVTHASVSRGEKIYQDYCLGCHGPVGDGNGPAAPYLVPKPLNFTTLKRNLVEGRYIGGILYYQIMNGVTGSAMPYFKKDLESAKIWDVGNYIEYSFINHRDDVLRREGIPAAFEGNEAGGYNPALRGAGRTGP
ncbi:MAG TPA: cbb3-type cytochrome c oxidase subunit II [Armatimonadota bacterium]|nr:cbb3-type cytochrome c oxidase subunit II [Armatimonadota bacterium]